MEQNDIWPVIIGDTFFVSVDSARNRKTPRNEGLPLLLVGIDVKRVSGQK